jgi:tetratricopeptide (TPR) repeat protein
MKLGRYDTALPLIERARVMREKALGPSHPDLADPLCLEGEIWLARKRPDVALPLLERALGMANASGKAELQVDVADALVGLGKDPARARDLVEQARAHFEEVGNRIGLDRATRWLEEHPRGG